MSRVLVLRALGLGDLLTAVPALRGIRRSFPDHRLSLATSAPLEPLVRLIGAVDDVVAAAPLAPLPPDEGGPDVAINLHGRGPESTRLLVDLRPGRLLAFSHPDVPASADGPTWTAGEHEVSRWCRMLAWFDIAADPSDLALAPPDRPIPDRLRGVTVIHPGASSPARQWPPERWGAVARVERSQGLRVVVTGSASELPLAQVVAAEAGLAPDDVLAGSTDVVTLAAIVATAGRVLCGDTGVAHLASAFATPSVVLFGPVPPSEWGPPPGPHRTIWKGSVGAAQADSVHTGLLAVTVDEVLEAISTLPQPGDGPVPG